MTYAEKASKPGTYAAYSRLLVEVHVAIRKNVPKGRTVLVVSRGDEQLVRLEGHRGWHFPRHEDGRWAGFHPADSVEAIGHLEELRAKGAQYLVFPETALWWLDYYEDLRAHLEGRYRIIDRGESCVIYDIKTSRGAAGTESVAGRSGHQRAVDGQDAESREWVDELRSAVAGALREGSTVLVVSGGDDRLLDLGNVRVLHFPCDEEGVHRDSSQWDDNQAIPDLERQRSRGARYLLFPNTALFWLDRSPEFAAYLHSRYAVVSRDDVCVVFDLAARPVSGVVNRLLPPGARIAVVNAEGGGLAGLEPMQAVELQPASQDASAAADIENLVAQGVEYLVIPNSAYSWLEERPALRQHLRERHRFVMHQRHLCEIYELSNG